MAEPHTPTSLTDTEVTIHTVPLPGEAKVLIFVEAKVSSTNGGVGVSSRSEHEAPAACPSGRGWHGRDKEGGPPGGSYRAGSRLPGGSSAPLRRFPGGYKQGPTLSVGASVSRGHRRGRSPHATAESVIDEHALRRQHESVKRLRRAEQCRY